MRQQQIRKLVNDAEADFRQCWAILGTLKATPDSRLAEFQPLLTGAMASLERAHRRIAKERQTLITERNRLQRERFVREQRRLDAQQKVLRSALGIGFSLGDAFVWFWYQFDSPLLTEHAKCARQTLPPGGAGGQIELAAAIALQPAIASARFLVLAHGTTTILRLGDVSLIDMRTWRVAAVGEIKSSPAENGIQQAQVVFRGHRARFRIKDLQEALNKAADEDRQGDAKHGFADTDESITELVRGAREPYRPLDLPPKMASRFKRQQRRLSASLETAQHAEDGHVLRADVEMKTHRYAALDAVVRGAKAGSAFATHAEDGLALVAIRCRGRTLHSRLVHWVNIAKEVERSSQPVETVLKTVVPGSVWNTIILGGIHYGNDDLPLLDAGAMPLAWWPIDGSTAEAVLLQDVCVLTAWNPASLLERFKSAGFEVTFEPNQGKLTLSRTTGNARRTMYDTGFIPNLIRHSLLSESEVVRMIEQFFERVPTDRPGASCRMDFQHHYFPPKTSKYLEQRASHAQAQQKRQQSRKTG